MILTLLIILIQLTLAATLVTHSDTPVKSYSRKLGIVILSLVPVVGAVPLVMYREFFIDQMDKFISN